MERYDRVVHLRIPKWIFNKIRSVVMANPDKYESISHYCRTTLMRDFRRLKR